jgi:Ca-activated chloride channel family protein
MNDQILNRTLSVRSVIALTAMFLIFSFASFAQSEKKYIRQGNREYEDKKYPESETTYRRALDENSESRDAVFNIGDALYKQKKYEDAAKQFIENQNINENKGKKSESLYNLGNSLLMANKLQESIDAYKGSLRLNPKKPEAKYNLAYAQDLLKQQQQQQQQQQQNDKNKQDQDKEDQSKNNDQQQKTPPQDQQQQDKQQGISREDAERVLNALENDEKNVQEKVKLAKALKEKVRTVKNW